MKVSVVISARNEYPSIVYAVHSIAEDLGSFLNYGDFEIIIVDNCSDDRKERRALGGTSDFLSTRGMYHNGVLRVMYYPVASNVGARNFGAQHAHGDYLFFSDAHMFYAHGTFERWIKTIDESGGIVHPAVSWIGAYPPQKGYQYSWKLGEEFKGCVDEKTEILTTGGWKKWYEATKEDEFVTVNTQTKNIEFQKPTDLLVADYAGKMVRFNGRSVDMLVTPEHRTIYDDYTGNWKVCPAKAYSDKHRIPITAESWENGSLETQYKDELVSLVGWIITEGSFRADGSIQITQYKKENHLAIRTLLERLGFTYFLKKRGDIVININPSREIKRILPEKKLTFDFVKSLNLKQASLLYDAMISGDGYRGPTITNFYQVDDETSGAFQFLCVLLGKATRDKIKKPWPNRFGKKPIHNISIKQSSYTTGFRVNTEEYVGKVWCPTLPNGTIFTKRNGIVNITGQTWNNYQVGDGSNWFYVPGMGHCSIGMKREQFLDFGGYLENRCYGGGEMYLDSLWWMMGSSSVTEPRINCYHLSSERGYSYVHDDYIRNVFASAFVLGADGWLERTYMNYLRKGRKDVLDFFMEDAKRQFYGKRMEVQSRLSMSFNDMIKNRPWDKLNQARLGTYMSGMLIYQDTWLSMIKGTPAEEVYPGEHQENLAEFIDAHLSEFVYRRTT